MENYYWEFQQSQLISKWLLEQFCSGVLVDYFIKSKTKEQLVASELLPEQSALDKTLEEIVQKNDTDKE